MVNSPLGLVMAGIRGNERRLQFLGIRTGAYKTTLFALSGGIAGLAGAIYALNLGFASPTFLGVGLSTIAIIWVLTGGAGTLVGPILGVILIEYVSRELSGRFLGWWQVGLGIILLVVVLFLREGLVGVLRGSSRLGRPEKGKP
jgi:ABC-type branched-subunit amino acid transport system permease subunit